MSYEPENPVSSIPDDAQAWLARELERLREETSQYTRAGYAQLSLSAPTVAGGTISTTPIPIQGFDRKLEPELGATATIAQSSIIILSPGHWEVTATVLARITAESGNYVRPVDMLVAETTSSFQRVVGTYVIPRYGDRITLAGRVILGSSELYPILGKEFILQLVAPERNVEVTNVDVLNWAVKRVSNEI